MGNEICKRLGLVLQGEPRPYSMEECVMREQMTVAELHWHQYLE
jgi:hypothetical protein